MQLHASKNAVRKRSPCFLKRSHSRRVCTVVLCTVQLSPPWHPRPPWHPLGRNYDWTVHANGADDPEGAMFRANVTAQTDAKYKVCLVWARAWVQVLTCALQSLVLDVHVAETSRHC